MRSYLSLLFTLLELNSADMLRPKNTPISPKKGRYRSHGGKTPNPNPCRRFCFITDPSLQLALFPGFDKTIYSSYLHVK